MQDADPEEIRIYGVQNNTEANQTNVSQRSLKKNFLIRNKEYLFEGPDEKDDVKELLQVLNAMQEQENKNAQSLLYKIEFVLNSIDKKLLDKCPFLLTKLKFDIHQLIITFCYWFIYILMVIQSIVILIFIYKKLQSYLVVQENDQRLLVAKHMLLLTFIYTLLTQIQQKISKKSIWAVLFIIQFLIPLFVLLDYYLNLFGTYSNSTNNYIGIAYSALFILIFLNSFLSFILLIYTEQVYCKIVATLLICLCHFLGSYLIGFQIIYFLIYNQSVDQLILFGNCLREIRVQLFFYLLCQSILFLSGIFKNLPEKIIRDLNFVANQSNQSNFVHLTMGCCNLGIYLQKILKSIKVQLLAPIIFVLIYTGLQIFNYSNLIFQLNQYPMNFQKIINWSFFLIFFHIFIFLGMIFQQTVFSLSIIQFWLSIITNILSLISLMISKQLLQYQITAPISHLIGFYPLIAILPWIFFSQFRYNQRPIQVFLILINCCLIVQPFIYSLVFSNYSEGDIQSEFLKYIIYVGAAAPILQMVILLMKSIYSFSLYLMFQYSLNEQQKKIDMQSIKNIDSGDSVLFFSSVLQIMEFHFFLHSIIDQSNFGKSQKRIIVSGSLITGFLQYFLIFKACKYIRSKSHLIKQNYKQTQQLFSIASVFVFILFLAIALPQSDEATKTILVWCAILIPIILLSQKLNLFIFKNQKEYAICILPFQLMLWRAIFFNLSEYNFLTLLIEDEKSEAYKNVQKICLLYFCFFYFFFLTILAIYFQNKFEQKIKIFNFQQQISTILSSENVVLSNKITSLLAKQVIQDNNDVINLNYNFMVTGCITNQNQFFHYVLLQNQSMIINGSNQNKKNKFWNNLQSKCLDSLQLMFCCYSQKNNQYLLIKKQLEPLNLDLQKEECMIQIMLTKSDEYLWRINELSFLYQIKQDKRFLGLVWLYIYLSFQEDLSPVFENLKIIVDKNILVQYSSFEELHYPLIKLTFNDFLLLICSDLSGTPIIDQDYLLSLTTQKYYFFIQNFTHLQYSFTEFIAMCDKENISTDLISIQQNLHFFIKQLAQIVKDQPYPEHQNQLNQSYSKFVNNCLKLNLFIYKFFNFIKQQLHFEKKSIKEEQTLSKSLQIHIQRNDDFQDLFSLIENKINQAIENNKARLAPENSLQFTYSFSNISALMSRIYEYFSFAIIALSPLTDWFQNANTNSNSKVEEIKGKLLQDWGILLNQYQISFRLALSIILCYSIIGLSAIYLMNLRVFKDLKNQKSSYTRGEFWMNKSLVLINSQFLFIMRTMLISLQCNYDVYPYTFFAEPQIECFTQNHIVYLIISFIGASTFYLLSTFIYPQLQFFDESLTFKFRPKFIILWMFQKLIVLGLSRIFQINDSQIQMYYYFQFGFICLTLYFRYQKPSLIENYNFKEVLFLILNQCLFNGAAIATQYESILAGWISIIIWLILFALIITYLKRRFSQSVSPQDHN